MMQSLSLSTIREPVQSQCKAELWAKNALASWLITNLSKLNVGSYCTHHSIEHGSNIKMSRGVRKSFNSRYINFLESFIVKRDFVNILRGYFFLTRGCDLKADSRLRWPNNF